MDPMVEGTLTWTALQTDDLPGLAELQRAIEYFDDPMSVQGLDELTDSFLAPGSSPRQNAVVGRDRGGTIVAYAWNHLRNEAAPRSQMWLEGGVHPAWRHQHLGEYLFGWQRSRAEEYLQQKAAEQGGDPVLWLGHSVEQQQASVVRLLEQLGMAPERWYFDMHRFFDDMADEPTVAVPTPEGVTLRRYSSEFSEPVRHAHNAACADFEGVNVVSREAWEAALSREEARPEWSWVALENDQVVGYAMNCANEEEWQDQEYSEGWTDRIGVLPSHRNTGVYRVLLIASMKSFQQAGLDAAGVGVDTGNPQDTSELFNNLGFKSQDMAVLYSMQATLADGEVLWTAPGALGPGPLG